MDEQLDNDLRDHIKAVFENYPDDAAHDGWLRLREKFPAKEKKRDVIWLWWTSAAAVLLLCIGFAIGLNLNIKQKNQLVNEVKHQTHSSFALNKPDSLRSTPLQGQNRSYAGGLSKPVISNSRAADALVIPNYSNNNSALAINSNRQTENLIQTNSTRYHRNPTKYSGSSLNNLTASFNDKDSTKSGYYSIQKKKPVPQDILLPSSDNTLFAEVTTKPVDSTINSVIISSKQEPSVIKPLAPRAKPQDMDALFASDKADKKPEEQKSKDKTILFGVFAGTYVNYASGSNNQMNLGAGITSDIRLAKNLRLATGISIGKNSFTYGTEPAMAIPNDAFAIHRETAVVHFAGMNTPSPTFQNYNASLMGLDIPINLKYEIIPKHSTYVSAGLSSGTFLNETYTYHYINPSLLSGASQTKDQVSSQNLGSFYWAKTVNFSFGTGYQITKSNRLIVEPFFKYPLGGLGTQQIHFGSGGLNLKLNFEQKH